MILGAVVMTAPISVEVAIQFSVRRRTLKHVLIKHITMNVSIYTY